MECEGTPVGQNERLGRFYYGSKKQEKKQRGRRKIERCVRITKRRSNFACESKKRVGQQNMGN